MASEDTEEATRLIYAFLHAVGRARALKTLDDERWATRWTEASRLGAQIAELGRACTETSPPADGDPPPRLRLVDEPLVGRHPTEDA